MRTINYSRYDMFCLKGGHKPYHVQISNVITMTFEEVSEELEKPRCRQRLCKSGFRGIIAFARSLVFVGNEVLLKRSGVPPSM